MSKFLDRIRALVTAGKYEITAHAFVELNNDGLLTQDVISGVSEAVVVEEYPDYHKGPSILVLQYDSEGQPVHALWGIAKGNSEPVSLVTAYRPEPDRWTSNYLKRRP
ncbi:MAG: DUF4258 domain-containing protein [Methylococcales bacterium]